MAWIWMILIGFFAGLIARAIKPGNDKLGFILTTLLGIVGAFIGGFLGRAIGVYEPGEPAGFIGAVIGAILLLTVVQWARGKRYA